MPLIVAATPIGNLGDISERALKALREADGIICEDTRISQILLNHHKIKNKLYVYTDQNRILEKLKEEQTLVLISDAGMPLVSDPGYPLIKMAYDENIPLTVIPGPSAVINALILSGLPVSTFYFGGFFDEKTFRDTNTLNATRVFFESPHRVIKTLEYLLNDNYQEKLVIVREMTKIYEERLLGTPKELLEHFKAIKGGNPKGEFVIVFQATPIECSDEEVDRLLENALKFMSLSQASSEIAKDTGLSKKIIYTRGLALLKKNDYQHA